MTTFVDTHCHLFNVTDVPLYEALRGKIRMGTLQKFFSVLAGGAAVLTNLDEKMIKQHRNFIRFFEREQQQNIEWFARQLREAVAVHQPGSELIVITPLIMDFDQVVEATNIGRDVEVARQFERLRQAIVAASKVLNEDAQIPVKIFPFMGFDLRKLVNTPTALAELQAFWSEHAASRAEIQKGNFAEIDNGKVLGLKLYPPLGFNPCPNKDKPAQEKAYLSFYRWCVAEDIPITVHCQPSSFTGMLDKDDVAKFTDSENWLQLFKNYDEFNGLRVNFAHFGGETELANALKGPWDESVGYFNPDRVNMKTWVGRLLCLLKEYPNTYADVSAFEFADVDARSNFAKLLGLEKEGRIKVAEGKYLLRDKLLWGSDVPMIISGDSYLKEKYRDESTPMGYAYLLGHFQSAVQGAGKLTDQEKQSLITAMTRDNPARFLLRRTCDSV